ncbi:MAG TPA: methyltransferase domain-containing protein [Myxococcaceae bacterium]
MSRNPVEKGEALNPEAMRRALSARRVGPLEFRAALTSVPESEREGWLNQVFGLEELPHDGPELPRGCVPYLPSPVDTLLRVIDGAKVGPDDVFVDVGSGLGRATVLTHFLTGASAIGVEIQPELVRSSRELASRLNAERVSVVEGDAAELTGSITTGSVFFLYCPFSGERLDRVMGDLEVIAQTREIRVCSVDLPLPSCSWLTPVSLSGDLAIYRSLR